MNLIILSELTCNEGLYFRFLTMMAKTELEYDVLVEAEKNKIDHYYKKLKRHGWHDFVDDFEVSGEAAPITGISGADSFFDAVDTATGGGGDRDDDSGPSAPTGPPSGGFQSESTYDAEEEDETPADRGGGNGGSSSGGGGCVIATHAVNSGAFTKDTKREAVRWCVKNLHRTWWGEAIRRGYRYYGQKAIEEGKAKNHYQEFKDYVAFGTGKRRTLKTTWTFVYRTIQFFIRGLFNAK